ncbi:MAG TPA: hypothetical protein DCQ31_11280 [Bacteroidales bacterium]|nr:hypothetical protein [Bacteroidales bacterium]
MSNQAFLSGGELPFCKGCGHTGIAQNTEKALQKMGMNPLDVIMVTDIGCHGIVDKNFLTHTFHGLHGRSVALASGLSAALNNPDKKVIVFVGDGGATIGINHIISAAHLGFNLTVVVHNNMLFGMTGGQPSEFTPQGFKTPTLPDGSHKNSFDICSVISSIEGTYVRRVTGIGDFSDALAETFAVKGFSLVEVMEMCPSYGVKSNPGMKLKTVVEASGLQTEVFADTDGRVFQPNKKEQTASLLNPKYEVTAKFSHNLSNKVKIMMAGSAGEGVQGAADMLAQAGMTAGLNVTKKGSYPVTVGVGFSAAEVILSPEEILYNGLYIPDVLIITSQDGLDYSKPAAKKMTTGTIFIDASLEAPETGAKVIKVPFREKVGARNSALASIFYYTKKYQSFEFEALKSVFATSKLSAKIDINIFLDL